MTAEKYQTYPTELVMRQVAIAASENDIEPRKVSLKGATQAVTAFAPKIEAARPENLIKDSNNPHVCSAVDETSWINSAQSRKQTTLIPTDLSKSTSM